MSNDVFCSVLIPASQQAAAQVKYPAYFVVGVSETGAAPATHFVSSGAFANDEMNEMVLNITNGWQFDFGRDLSAALANWGVQFVPTEQPA